MSGIKASNTTPYNPQGDGQVERYNRTLLNMLRTLSQKEKKDWRKHLPKLAFAVNSTKSKATQYSPFFLLYGREPKLPIDGVFQEAQECHELKRKSHDQFAREWELSMRDAYDVARSNIEKLSGYNKRHYDAKAKAVDIQVGDLVLVQNMREREGKAKMRSYWEENLFKVTEVKKNVPVYTITNVRKSKDVRVVHRNKLMRVNELPMNVFGEGESTGKKQKEVQKKAKKQVSSRNLKSISQSNHGSDDSDDRVVLVEGSPVPDVVNVPVVPGDDDPVPEVVADEEDPEEIPFLADTDSADETIPYEEDVTLVGGDVLDPGPEETDSDSSTENVIVRRSARGRVPKMMLSHAELGGDMVMVPVGT